MTISQARINYLQGVFEHDIQGTMRVFCPEYYIGGHCADSNVLCIDSTQCPVGISTLNCPFTMKREI